MQVFCIGSLIAFHSIVSVSQEVDPRVLQVKADMKAVGLAIERLYKDKGVLLVDLTDDDTPEGLERIRTAFEGVGMPVNGVRTLRDVFLPLVHFGYLDRIPSDPFIPTDATAEWNTFIYIDEEETIPGNDGFFPPFYYRFYYPSIQNWYLISPGLDSGFQNHDANDIVLSRYQLYMQPPLLEGVLQRDRQNFALLGEAIEMLRAEKGGLLVDYWDDDTSVGIDRLLRIFEGAGAEHFPTRPVAFLYAPLVHFGYISEIPVDPVVVPYPVALPEPLELEDGAESFDIYPLGVTQYYYYQDNDPEISGNDSNTQAFNVTLEEGAWILIGYEPDSTKLDPIDLVHNKSVIKYHSRNMQSSVSSWELYGNPWEEGAL